MIEIIKLAGVAVLVLATLGFNIVCTLGTFLVGWWCLSKFLFS